jgi:hypothetical protein
VQPRERAQRIQPPFVERGLTQYMRLDVCTIGGFTESLKVAGWCEAHYIDLFPHNPLGPVCTAASIHFAAVVPNFAWLEYNRAFGTSDPFSAMINGLHGLARDVALMRVLGPNPRAGLAYAEQVAMKRSATIGSAKLENRVRSQAAVAKTMLAHWDGTANRAERVAWARFFAGTRAVLTSIQLGSAVLSSITDVATITAAAHTMSMSASNVLARSVKLMASQATRETAARMGYVAETLADAGAGMSRFFGQTYASGLPDRMAGFTLRATGL